MTPRRWASVLLLIGLLFCEGFAVAPVRADNTLNAAIVIVCADPDGEVQTAPRAAAAYPLRSAIHPYEAPAPAATPAFALFQRPPPPAA